MPVSVKARPGNAKYRRVLIPLPAGAHAKREANPTSTFAKFPIAAVIVNRASMVLSRMHAKLCPWCPTELGTY